MSSRIEMCLKSAVASESLRASLTLEWVDCIVVTVKSTLSIEVSIARRAMERVIFPHMVVHLLLGPESKSAVWAFEVVYGFLMLLQAISTVEDLVTIIAFPCFGVSMGREVGVKVGSCVERRSTTVIAPGRTHLDVVSKGQTSVFWYER